MRNYVHLLSVLALILAGISPACKFISGQMLVEICTADGIALVAMDSGSVPAKEKQDQKKTADCGFCFAQTHMKPLQFAALALSLPLQGSAEYRFSSTAALSPYAHGGFSARAPPSLT